MVPKKDKFHFWGALLRAGCFSEVWLRVLFMGYLKRDLWRSWKKIFRLQIFSNFFRVCESGFETLVLACITNYNPDLVPDSDSWDTAEKIFLFQTLPTFYLSLGLHKGRPKLQEKSSFLKSEHPALQNSNFLHFCGSFLPYWIRIPDSEYGSGSLTWLNPNLLRIRIRNTVLLTQDQSLL